MKEPLDFRNCSPESICNYFLTLVDIGTSPKDYYCGITNNVGKNLQRHGVKEYLTCVRCASFKISAEVEKLLGEKEFDIGNPNNDAGNGGVKNSTIVYMIKKGNGFIR